MAVTCPHCWHRCEVDEILAVARHDELLGDPVLGPDRPQRFLPSRFTPQGHAIDAHGMSCPDIACPRCHLIIPHCLIEKHPVFLSIIGAVGSGKSYFLASMVWELRRLMPKTFAFTFGDADSTSNRIVNEYERTLFLPDDDEAPAMLAKTELQGSLYKQVSLDGMSVRLPYPFMFNLTAQPHHPWFAQKGEALNQTLVLYDNAGEHFEPGRDSPQNPGTQHLAKSSVLFFLFDPTKDPRFRERCRSDDPQMGRGKTVAQQEVLLTETVTRIRRYKAMASNARCLRTLIVVVTKLDIWRSLLGESLPKPLRTLHHRPISALDQDSIMVTSFAVRHLLMELCPEIPATAEAHASRVIYLPVSALGHSPMDDPNGSGNLLVRPKDIRPEWVSVPMLYALGLFKMLPLVNSKRTDRLPVATDCHPSGNTLLLRVPGNGLPLEVPSTYWGRAMRCPKSGMWFRIPSKEELESPGAS